MMLGIRQRPDQTAKRSYSNRNIMARTRKMKFHSMPALGVGCRGKDVLYFKPFTANEKM